MLDKEVAGLLRFPVIAVSIVFLLWLMRLVLGFDITELTWGDFAVKFKVQQDSAVAIAGVDSKVDLALARLGALEKTRHQVGTSSVLSEGEKEAQSLKQLEASETVSDDTAALASKQGADETVFKNSTGFVWIGNHNANGRGWTALKLATEKNGKGIPADKLTVGGIYYTKGNLVVRSSMPSNDASYFNSIPIAAIVPSGSKVKINKVAQSIDREYTVQWWVSVEVAQ